MDPQLLIQRASQALQGITPTLVSLDDLSQARANMQSGLERGYFSPDEDSQIHGAFSRYLTSRAVLLEVIDDLEPLALGRWPGAATGDVQRAFLVAYTASCLLVRAGRHVVNQIAGEDLMRRKLDQACPELGIPEGQFTLLYRALTRPRNAWRLHQAQSYADSHRAELEAVAIEANLQDVLSLLEASEQSVRVSITRYLKGRIRFRWHSWLTRRRSELKRATFAIYEGSGRLVSRLRLPWFKKRVNRTVQRKLREILLPGDVLVTRHHDAATNLFLPGYWPHAALHLGPHATEQEYGVSVDKGRKRRWCDEISVLEAQKDGVHFRRLETTLAVDAVVVLRPRLPKPLISEGLSRALTHEGKLYDFTFDFTRSDRLVCTEVVYRAYDGLGPLQFELTPRAGRLTLSAEDLLDLAVEDRGFEPVAIFGTPLSRRRLVLGEAARAALLASYRKDRPVSRHPE